MISSRCASAHSGEMSPASSCHASPARRPSPAAAVAFFFVSTVDSIVLTRSRWNPRYDCAPASDSASCSARSALVMRRCATTDTPIDTPVASSKGSDSTGAINAAGTASSAVVAPMR